MKFWRRKVGLPRLPDHESAVRRLVADSRGEPYRALRTLEEAKSVPDSVVVLEADDGGQIYIVVPTRLVGCSAEALEKLLRDLDSKAWPGNDAGSARVFYERWPVESGVAGGLGGGLVTEGVWIHPQLQHLRRAIEEVIAGRAPSIGESSL